MKSAMLAVWHFVFETTNFDFTILQLLFHLFSQMSTYECDKRGARYRKIWKMAVLHPIVHWNVFPDWRKHLGNGENGFLTSSLCVSYKWGFHLESLERQRQRQMCVMKMKEEIPSRIDWKCKPCSSQSKRGQNFSPPLHWCEIASISGTNNLSLQTYWTFLVVVCLWPSFG